MKFAKAVLILPLSLVFLLACNAASKTTSSQISADEIYKMIEKGRNVFIQDAKISGNLDLTGLSEKTPMRSTENKIIIRSSVAFKNCHFLGEITGYKMVGSSDETSCIFQSPVYFDVCIFDKNFNLKNAVFQNSFVISACTFNKDIILDNSQMISDFDLVNCKVRGTSNFQNTYFNQKSNFFKTDFDSTCQFQSGFFNSVAQFNDVSFNKYTDFSLSIFNSRAFFNYAKFYGRNLFNNCSFRNQVEFNYAHFHNTVFDKSSFSHESKFNEIEIKDKLDLSTSRFLYSKPFISNNSDTVKARIIGSGD
ncbi:MAG: hypothetical protein ABIN36_05760 [Ferruginibacter sp.]